MFRFPRVRSSRALAVVAGGAVLVMLTTGVALATTSSGYSACANSSGRLGLESSAGKCPSHFSKVSVGAQGPRGPKGAAGSPGAQGPSGVVSMTQYEPDGATAVTADSFGFLGSPAEEYFANGDTAAEVVATVDTASADGNAIDEVLGVCYEPVGGSTVQNVDYVIPQFQAPEDSYFTQTVSGDVGDLSAAYYYVGVCAEDQNDVINGAASVTITMAQTTSGVTYEGALASPARLRRQSRQ
jgi:hypothetical protein